VFPGVECGNFIISAFCFISIHLHSLVAVFDSGKFLCLKWWTLVTILEILPRHALDRQFFFIYSNSVSHLFNSPIWFAAISSLHLEACILVRASYFVIP
jgi:hypothetical protein